MVGFKMTGKCTGQDFRNLRVLLHKCPNCTAEVEVFSDEMKTKCQKCGEPVYRDKIPSCMDWCASGTSVFGGDKMEGTPWSLTFASLSFCSEIVLKYNDVKEVRDGTAV